MWVFQESPPTHRGIEQIIISEEPVIMVVPHDGFDWESGPPINYEDILFRLPLLTHNHPEYWEELLSHIQAQYVVKTMRVSQVSTTKHFIEEGLGFSFLPELAVRRELAEGRLLRVDEHPFTLPATRTYLLTPQHPSAIMRQFCHFSIQLLGIE
ncbi:hypothetical protein GCM10011391_11300 [Pullulanibacillus camelliae]|uniref:LysR substrate-binding domain-containing protein n=1 Tax=Pullulanibacillus camelliae TaxID=1707096 RepID=A0A8J2VKD6_9BACL|nr:substrate-binding domain-containing protein [Pullulanibacillus camelliae]GGE34349.1 hypothetical protein GCM10011391_11300 [Pullulanibacillus camelliae]